MKNKSEENTVACSVGGPENGLDRYTVMLVDVNSGKEQETTSQRWALVLQVAWTPSGDGILVSAQETQDPRQLTSNAALNGLPAVSADGRFIVFVSTRTGAPHLWRMDSDGANVKQLTNGIAEVYPTISPDGQWVVYQNVTASELGLWKISIDGGTPSQLTNKLASQAAISPDGKLVACRYREAALTPFKLGLISFMTGETVKTIDTPPTFANLEWTSDGRGVVYVDSRGGVSNLWSQPIDGGAPRQLTNFKSDLMFAFDFSKDRKSLVLSRGTVSNDVVLIADVSE